jgi:pyruvate formate lyase activating enzyme
MTHPKRGLVFNIQHYSLHDGPGIRTTVFFKGCPLNCLWCSTPESIRSIPQIGFHRQRCIKDYRCLKVCSLEAVRIFEDQGLPLFDKDKCEACVNHPCIEACIQRAIEVRGNYVSLEELWRAVEKDRLFYLNSGGGVTLSGGEPTMQHDFVIPFLRRCQERGVHTVLDTCGYVSWEILVKILEYTNLVLYDLKHIDSVRHRELTGVPNELILDNAKKITSNSKTPMILRMPIIPGYNDSRSNIEDTAEFIGEIGLKEINLLPYHRFALGKYEIIGKKYTLEDVQCPTEDSLTRIVEIFQSKGVSGFF